MSTVLRAFRHPALWLGLVGSVLLVAGAYAMPTIPQNLTDLGPIHAWWWRMRGKGPHLIALGVLALGIAFLLLRPANRRGPVNPWVPFAVWCAPLLLSVPILSPDLFSYMDYSWMLHEHLDPYKTGLGTVPGPYQRVSDPIWHGVISVYPALDMRLYQLFALLAGYRVIPTMVLSRLPALIGVVLGGLCLPELARRRNIDPQRALWLWLLNPITIVAGVGGAHNDAAMAGLCVAAVWLAYRRWGWVWCAIVAGLACGIKQPGLLVALTGAMIATPQRGWGRRIAYGAAALVVAGVVFVATSLATGLGMGWIHGLSVPSSVATLAPLNVTTRFVNTAFGIDLTNQLKYAGYAVMALAALWYVVRRWERPMIATAGIFFVYTILSPAMHAWYLLPTVAFLAVSRISELLRSLVAGLVVYLLVGTVLDQGYRVDPFEAAFLGADTALAVVWIWQNRRRARSVLALDLPTDGTLPQGAVKEADEERRPHDPVTGELLEEAR